MTLWKQQGLSILETVVAIGVLGVMSAGVATLYANFAKATNTISAKQDLQSIVFDVQSQLSSPGGCATSIITNKFDPKKAKQRSDRKNRGMDISLQLSNKEVMKKNAALKNYGLRVERVYLADASVL